MFFFTARLCRGGHANRMESSPPPACTLPLQRQQLRAPLPGERWAIATKRLVQAEQLMDAAARLPTVGSWDLSPRESGSFARGRCRRGRSEIPHFCSRLLLFALLL